MNQVAMAEVQNRLAKLKSEVRGLLISSPRGVTLIQFLKDYKEAIGKPFPNREFGYETVEGLLLEINDVVKINSSHKGIHSTLVPVSSEKVNHINAMVSRQKMASNKFSNCSIPRRCVQDEPDTKNIRKPVQLPLESKHLIEKNTELSKNGTPHNPHSYGEYQNMPDWYSNVPGDAANSNNYENARSYKNKEHTFQDSTSSTFNNGYNRDLCDDFKHPNNFQMWNNMEEFDPLDPAQITGKVKEFFNRIGDIKENKPNPPGPTLCELIQSKCYQDINDLREEDDLERPPTPGEVIITEKMKNNFRELLADYHPEGIPSSKFCKLYKEKFGAPLNYFNYGVKSFNEMIANIPDVFTYRQQRSSHQEWILYDSSYPLPTSELQRWIPCDILKNITELCLQFPDGIKYSEILELYRQRFNAELDIRRLGFNSLKSFLQSCSNVELININGDDMVCPIYQTSSTDSEPHYALPPISEMPFLWGSQFSEDECSPSLTYHPFKLIKKDKLNYAKVYVCDVISPSQIWLQMDEQRDDLDKLMFSLNKYYDKYEEKHRLTDHSFVIKDLICTVRFAMDNRWHRAKILSDSGSVQQVSVLYVDYGTIENHVPIDSIRKLLKEFYSLPVQAIQSSLYGLVPNPKDGSVWTSKCIDFIFDLMIEKKFNMDVVNIDESIPKLEVILHDGKKSLTINDQLLSQGHALSIGHMPLLEDDHLSIEISEDLPEDDVPYPSMLHESLSVRSNGGSDQRIRTPPGYSSRTMTPLTSSSSTCQRIKDLRDDTENLCKQIEQLLEIARKKFLEADVLENHVCKHPHPMPCTLKRFSSWLQNKTDQPNNFFTPIDSDTFNHKPEPAMKREENVPGNFNHPPPDRMPMPAPRMSCNIHQDPRACTMHCGMNQGSHINHPSYNTHFPPHPYHMMQNRQDVQIAPIPNRLPQQLPPFQYYAHEIMPNIIPNKMVGPPVVMGNQTQFMPGQMHIVYNQQNAMYPPNMGHWSGERYPNVVHPNHRQNNLSKPIDKPVISPEKASCTDDKSSIPLENIKIINSDESPSTMPNDKVEEINTEINDLQTAPTETNDVSSVPTPLPELDEEKASPIPSCDIDMSHLSQKQIEKLKPTGETLIHPPNTNNWSELLAMNNISSATTTPSIPSEDNSDPNRSKNVENNQANEGNEKLDDEYKKLDDAITETMGLSKVAVNHIMKICVQNIHDQSCNILLLLVGDSVAVLLGQLYINYWLGSRHGEDHDYDDFISNLKDLSLPAYSIFYTDHIPIFDRLRHEKLIAEDDLYVHVVNLCDVSHILDFICPDESDNLSSIKDIFKELYKMVLPEDEFWYTEKSLAE